MFRKPGAYVYAFIHRPYYGAVGDKESLVPVERLADVWNSQVAGSGLTFGADSSISPSIPPFAGQATASEIAAELEAARNVESKLVGTAVNIGLDEPDSNQ